MDDGSTDEADAGKVMRWAEGCRRHKAVRQLVKRHKQPLPRSESWRTSPESWGSERPFIASSSSTRPCGTVDALQPSATGRKSGTWVLPRATEQIIEETIRDVYLKPTWPTLTHLVACVHARCSEAGIAPPDRRTVRTRVKAVDIRVRGQRRPQIRSHIDS
jgi:putative transposase